MLGKALLEYHAPPPPPRRRAAAGRSLPQPLCRGIVTADVLELGLSRGAIAARKLKGVKRDKEYEGLYWFSPLR